MMRKLLLIIHTILFLSISVYAQKISFDYKYVTVGVYGNRSSWPAAMQNSNNFRYLGTSLPSYDANKTYQEIEKDLNDKRMGKKILDILLERDYSGLHMDRLYDQALRNTTLEEIEVAIKDVSAETKDILKREIAHQLLKNNYIVVFQTIEKNSWRGPKENYQWSVYHIEINDKIIEQVYSNWRTPNKYDQITVPVKFVAKGKIRKSVDNANLVFKIAKKVPAFAVRGPLTGRFPHTARITKKQGVKNSDRICIYRIKENRKGDIFSKKVCLTRASEVDDNSCKMFRIAGYMPSLKKGEIAVLRDRKKSSVSLLGEYSGGDDARKGYKVQYNYLFNCRNGGFTNYLIAATNYNKFKKEPLGIWWCQDKSIQPVLSQRDFTAGYGLGINLLGRIEIMPYVLAGLSVSHFDIKESELRYLDYERGKWVKYNYGLIDATGEPFEQFSWNFIFYAGAQMNINLHYPLQLVLGCDCNYIARIEDKPEQQEYQDPNAKNEYPYLDRHILNRVNLYAGLRFNF